MSAGINAAGNRVNRGAKPETLSRLNAGSQHSILSVLSAVPRGVLWILILPLKIYLSVRRSMTAASIVAMLGVVLTLNIIWGFPWSGMMGGCVAILTAGWLINRLLQPKLSMHVALPRFAVAGQPFSVGVNLTNERYFPAMDLRLGWHREGVRDVYHPGNLKDWDASPPVSVSLVRSGDQARWQGAMRFDTRGIHTIPPFQVATTFPFHLFHCRRDLPTDAQIAITPRPLLVEEDPTARMMLSVIGDWTHHLVAGAPVEYVGNREYQVGMPVRKWDFASWARLGRPIVREYQSPSIQSVILLVDTSLPEDGSASISAKKQQKLDDALFERLMSVAASAVTEICSRRVQLALYLTSEPSGDFSPRSGSVAGVDGPEPLLIRLAYAERVGSAVSLQRIENVIEVSQGQPVLMLSLFDFESPERRELSGRLPANVTLVPVKNEAGLSVDPMG